MSWLFAKLYDRFTRAAEEGGLRDWRRELLSRVRGDVLEIGAGTGPNLPLYPRKGVRRLLVTEPDRHMFRQLERRAAAIDIAGLELRRAPADELPVPDASFDWAVSTLVLCTVPDLEAVLGELRRVLRPGGRLLFLEHVAWEDPARYRWQRLFEPFWRWFAEGCRLTRRTGDLLLDSGFEFEDLVEAPMPKAPPIVRRTLRGVARRSDALISAGSS